ncbi:hypothetical protein RCH06_003131 [Polaromonas sp. CG_9.5]|uniref:hypothetical protein n=1 Tax=Polaromonas sp. CG_9.5 TaxID=3071705 RepID=UPI002DF9B096|nr:hypothetical protein [Polaromonas sp. CG_9.5]
MTQPAHSWRSHYALLMLLFVHTMSFIDWKIMGILVQPIKQEFGVSDTAMGMLSDFLVPQYGNEALRWALVLTTGACFLLGMLAFICTLGPYAVERLTLASRPRPAALLAATAS